MAVLLSAGLPLDRALALAIGNIEKSRAQYGVSRAALLPSLALSGSETRARTPASVSLSGQAYTASEYSAQLGFTAYELDLFGRVRSLSEAARQSYLATAEDRRTAQISLIAQVAGSDLQLAADLQLLALSRDTFKARDESRRILQLQFDHGAASQLDLAQADGLAQQARSDIAAATARVEQDRNALRLLLAPTCPRRWSPIRTWRPWRSAGT